jgi:hypothetical protein
LETYRLHSVWLLFLLLPKLPVPLPILPMVSLRCDAKRATAASRHGFWTAGGKLAYRTPACGMTIRTRGGAHRPPSGSFEEI